MQFSSLDEEEICNQEITTETHESQQARLALARKHVG